LRERNLSVVVDMANNDLYFVMQFYRSFLSKPVSDYYNRFFCCL